VSIVNSKQAVACMHDIARYVEHHIGSGSLSSDIRQVADRLHEVSTKELRKPVPTAASLKAKQ